MEGVGCGGGTSGWSGCLVGKTSPHGERVLEVNIHFEAGILR